VDSGSSLKVIDRLERRIRQEEPTIKRIVIEGESLRAKASQSRVA
jgi:FtsZ-binding cell division protein ZapB